MIKVIALMGKSGAGKDHMLRELARANPDLLHTVINTTTRPPREGEQDGVHYYFVSEEEYFKREYIEKTAFRDWFYGTELKAFNKNKINIGVFTPKGIRILLQNKDIDLKIVYLRAAPKERLIRQLERQSNPDVAEIIRRYNEDEADYENIEFPTFDIVNETPLDLFTGIEKIFESLGPWMNEGKTD